MLFGLLHTALVLTPDGLRPLGALAVGDEILAWNAAGRALVARRVTRIHDGAADHLYRLETPIATLAGCTPGVQVFDTSEDMFRGAGSLSAIAEMAVWRDGELTSQPLTDAVEFTAPGTAVRFLAHDGDEPTFFADGFLLRHPAAR